MRTQNPKSNNSVAELYIKKHFQSLILARVQCMAQCTSSPIISSQAAELINSYRVIWTAISQLVLHNCGALLNNSLCQKSQCKPAQLLACTALHLLAHSSQICYCGLSSSHASSTQATCHFRLQPRVQCFQNSCF